MTDKLFNERQLAAFAGLFYIRGGKVRRHKTKRPFGSDAYVANEAHVTVYDPYRMPSECVMLFNEDQAAFFWSCVKVLDRVKAENLRDQATAEVYEYMRRGEG